MKSKTNNQFSIMKYSKQQAGLKNILTNKKDDSAL